MTTERPANINDDHSTTTPKVVEYTVAIVGVALILLGIIHTVVGLPLVFNPNYSPARLA